jgi:hypothetical protein
MALTSVSTSRGRCTTGATVACALGTMAPGESARIVVEGTAAREGSYTVAYGVGSKQSDPKVAGDNAGTLALEIAGPAPVARAGAEAFSAPVAATVTRSSLPPTPATPRWRLRVWLSLRADRAAPAKLQLAENTARPWAWRSFGTSISLRTRLHTISIRFADASGAVSDWQRISIP